MAFRLYSLVYTRESFFLDSMVIPFFSLLKSVHNDLYNSWMNSHFPNSAIPGVLNGDDFTD